MRWTSLVELLDLTAAHDRVCVGSFSGRRIAGLPQGERRPGGDLGGPLGGRRGQVPRAVPHARGAAALQVPWKHKQRRLAITTPGLVRRAHRAGLHVHVWTGDEASQWVSIDDPESLHTLLDMGVDGVITDRTDVLKEVLVERGQWRDHP